MATLRAITFDFWSTLIDGTPTPERTAQRVARLHRAIAGAGAACTADELLDAFQRVTERFDFAGRERESFEEVGPAGRWAALATELGIPDGLIPYEVVERAYEDISLNPLPDAMPHVQETVEATKQAGFRLGVICNTGMTGGRVLREVLRRHGLLEYFDAMSFSDELGISKPHPSIFLHTLAELGGIAPGQALHVGDIEDLDVAGARQTGMHAALYAPEANGEIPTQADFVVRDWRDFTAQVAEFEGLA